MAGLTVVLVPVQCVVMQKGDGKKIERNEGETVDREESEGRRGKTGSNRGRTVDRKGN